MLLLRHTVLQLLQVGPAFRRQHTGPAEKSAASTPAKYSLRPDGAVVSSPAPTIEATVFSRVGVDASTFVNRK
jgi:hypothetical protein